ncbi:hypothetical protein MSAN_01738600 [Mycena sanguinolenta]|uniref:F-box domain-containing protein n=1 Tax=Mycena sanguinolenta TaxID=230812 RepID=A0A8H7CW33_9AGAR|nr:hypothetical protein MSAN_01738600 [Mycena sanguinolenta]
MHLKSMSMRLPLSDLPADITFSIFARCDIASVVSVSQTCRYLHALAFEKCVWLVLLGNLRRRCILDRNCTPHLETLSTPEMIQIVKRLLTGPQTWSPRELHCDSVAQIFRKITLHPKIDLLTRRWSVVRLLPSGRYLLFSNVNRFECWSVANDSLVWTYTSSVEKVRVQEFAAEETDTDVTIMVCLDTYLNSNPGQNCIEIVKLDLQTMTHTSLLIALVPRHTHVFCGPLICGALAAVSCLNATTGENLHMVLNLERKSYCILQGTDRDNVFSGPHVALIPGHILLSEKDWLYLISSDTLGSYWAQIVGADSLAQFSPVLVKDISKLRMLEASDVEQSFGDIYVHESPIRNGDYSFWIYGASRTADRGAFLSYRLSIPTSGDPQWCLQIKSLVEPGQAPENFYQAATYGALPFTSARTVLVELPPDLGEDIDIAPYSDLPPDIIFSIFACCDIASVVSVSQTCRYLHALAFEKSVWLVLLDNLRRRCILDRNCTPNIDTLSTTEMIDIVKRLITGPQTWSPEELDSMSEISRKITLHPAIVAEDSYWNVPELLRSGHYVLFINSYRLECWSVADDRLVWTHTFPMEDMEPPMEVYGFAAEEADANLTIAVCFTASLNNKARKYVEIVDLDLQAGTHTSLLVARVPESDHPDAFSEPAICGEIVPVTLSVDLGDLYMIVNWREKLYLILQGGDQDAQLHGALILGHILLSDEDQLHLISSGSLSTHWAPIVPADGPAEFSPVSLKDISKLRTIEASHAEQSFDRLDAHESPIRDGYYSVGISGMHRVHHRDAFLSYQLSIPANGEPQWFQRTRSALEPGLSHSHHPITYHGHSLAFGASHEHGFFTIFSTAAAALVRAAQVELAPSNATQIDLAAYSDEVGFAITLVFLRTYTLFLGPHDAETSILQLHLILDPARYY